MNLYIAPPEPHTGDVIGDGFALLDKAHDARQEYHRKVHALVDALPRVPVTTLDGSESWRLLSYTSLHVTLARDGHTVLYGCPVRFKRDGRCGVGPNGRGLTCGHVEQLIQRITQRRSW